MKRTGLAALAVPTTVLMGALWMAIACTSGNGNSPAPVATSGPGRPSAVPSLAAPGASSIAAPPASAGASGTQDPNAPPDGSLSADGAQVLGMTGSYCWTVAGTSSCIDSPPFTDSGPALPQMTLATSSTQLTFALANGFPFASWSASYVDDNGNVVALGGEGSSFDPDAAHQSLAPKTTAAFDAPPAHDQSIVQVFVRFADGGDASYGWNVTVP